MDDAAYEEPGDDISGNFLLLRPDNELFSVTRRAWGDDGEYVFTEEGAEWFRDNIHNLYHITPVDRFLAVYFTNDMDFINAKLRWESKSFDEPTDL
jgi:hypothetical protein